MNLFAGHHTRDIDVEIDMHLLVRYNDNIEKILIYTLEVAVVSPVIL